MRNRVLASLVLANAVLLVGASSMGARAATASTVHIRAVDSSGFPTVAVTVSTVGSVAPGAISLTENGTAATVLSRRTLSQSGGTFDVVLAIDTSDSVKGAPEAAAVAAAKQFVNGLPAGVPVGVVTFSDKARVVQAISSDRSAAVKALAGITGTQHGTALYDAVATASGMFSGSSQHNLVLLTDGKDVGSSASLTSALRTARKAHVGAFTVALGATADRTVLQRIAGSTFGSFFPAVQSDLSSIYQSLAKEFSNQFVLTYRSTAARGTQVSIGASASGGTDTAVVLLPKAPHTVPPPAEPGSGTPLLHGNVGMAIALGLTFLALFVIVGLALGVGTKARRERRLSRMMSASPQATPVEADESPKQSTGWIPEPLVEVAERVAGKGVVPALRHRLEQGELRLQPGEFLLMSLGGLVFGGLLGGALLSSILFGVLVGVALGATPWIVLMLAVRRRSKALHAQLPDVLMMLASSLRAGHGFLAALDTVAQEVGDPIAGELSRVVAEVRLGRKPDEAMSAMAERVDSDDFRWAAMSVNIQREVGGNLAEILDTVAETVRERDVVRRQIDVLSAEGKLSAWILIALPVVIGLYIAKVNPSYMKLLFTTTIGIVISVGGVVLLVIGMWWLRKIVRIDV